MNPLAIFLTFLGLGAISSLVSSDDGSAGAEVKKEGSSSKVPADTTYQPQSEDGQVPDETAQDNSNGGHSPAPAPIDPRPAPPPAEPAPAPADPAPAPPTQTGGTGSDGGETEPVADAGTVEVIGGRVTTLAPEGGDVAGLRIVSGVEHGHVTVNPDNTMALVMTLSDFTGSQSFTYEVTRSDGSTALHEVDLRVVDGQQDLGWATGTSHYMLATDENDRVVVEHGDNHTKVHISGSDRALSLSDIAAIEGMDVSEITGRWLASHGVYGETEDMALDMEAGIALWNTITSRGSVSSNWLLFEKGYEYSYTEGRMLQRYTSGEDEMKPLYIGAWGDGDKPVIQSGLGIATTNVVVQGLTFTGAVNVSSLSENVILDDLTFSFAGLALAEAKGITIRNSDFFDLHHDSPSDTGHLAAIYGNGNDGLLLEGNIFDLNGWRPDVMDATMFNHNVYLGHANTDVTVRDTISMRGSSIGIQVRSGGFIEDNVSIDNNVGMNSLGGDTSNIGPVGHYTLFADNLVTSAGYHEDAAGAYSLGIHNDSYLTSLVDNIVTHLADPANHDEFLEKYWTNEALLNEKTPYYDDTIVWNWIGSRSLDLDAYRFDKNYEGLDTGVLDETTIQKFTAALLGKPDATIADLGAYLRAQAADDLEDVVDADLIIRFFQEGFGIAPDLRAEAETLRFVPSDLGDGVRWDNRLNWSTDDLPGTQDGDSVNLAGNHVVFGMNADIDRLEIGHNGGLTVYGGRLDVEGGVVGGGYQSLDVEGAGQIWIDGNAGRGRLDIDVEGGRLVNTGLLSETDLGIESGQTILATDAAEFDLGDGHRLAVASSEAEVGFDGDRGGMAILDMHEGATLAYSAKSGDLGSIEEFRSGAFGDAPDVLSGIDLGGVTLEIDLVGLDAAAGNAFTLMSADELVGIIDEATLHVGGLGARDATIVVDYVSDMVRLELTAGSGKVGVSTVGSEAHHATEEDALWTALTNGHDVVDDAALDDAEAEVVGPV